jgi:hypothetical protein
VLQRQCLVAAATLWLAAPAPARLPSQAPALPPPDPGRYEIVQVDTPQELADACWNLESGQAIVVAPGTYDLGDVDFPNGVDGRLTVGRFGAPPIADVQIRGATGDPADVVLVGRGALDPLVPFGFQIFTATDVLIADLSIGSVYYHAVAIQGDQGAERVRLYHLRAFDAGQQIVKGIAGAHDVAIEYSEIFHTAGAPQHPEGSPPGSCYTNGVDALGVSGWVLSDNLIRGIYCQDGTLAGPAVLLWQGATDTVVERNTLLESSRGIHLGLGPGDHAGGLVRENFLRWDPDAPYVVDVGIYTVSPGSRLLHNTVLTAGRYPNAVEVRFASATGVEVRHNLLDAAIQPRDGAEPVVEDNLTNAQAAWFIAPEGGDLHLTARATPALDQVDALSAAPDDFDGGARPAAPGTTDLGADERGAGGPIFADGFESGDTAAWTSTVAQPR